MKKYLLDTNICIYYLKGRFELDSKIAEVGMINCFISEITVAELKIFMNKTILLPLLLIFTSCVPQEVNYIKDYDGIAVEKLEKSNLDENKYTVDNKIYSVGQKFTYSYYHQTTDGKKYLIAKGEQIKRGDYFINSWKFIEIDNQNAETIKNIILTPNSGNPFKDQNPNYNQTAILYDYVQNNTSSFAREITGAIENRINVWIHPPRSSYFKILELNPFPYIKTPYQIGNKWNWKLEIGDHWSDKRWMEWKGSITNHYQYEIVDKKKIPTNLGVIECYLIRANAKSQLGETELLSYFNKVHGFVKLEYRNIDGSKTIMELEKQK